MSEQRALVVSMVMATGFAALGIVLGPVMVRKATLTERQIEVLRALECIHQVC
jgi:hypothetical protein